MSRTDVFRALVWILWTVVVLAALVGWGWFDRDPGQLAPVMGWVTGALAIGEGANNLKRATWKKEAAEATDAT